MSTAGAEGNNEQVLAANATTATISDTAVQSTSKLFVSPTAGTSISGSLSAGSITAGTNFVVSTTVAESSTISFNYLIIN